MPDWPVGADLRVPGVEVAVDSMKSLELRPERPLESDFVAGNVVSKNRDERREGFRNAAALGHERMNIA